MIEVRFGNLLKKDNVYKIKAIEKNVLVLEYNHLVEGSPGPELDQYIKKEIRVIIKDEKFIFLCAQGVVIKEGEKFQVLSGCVLKFN